LEQGEISPDGKQLFYFATPQTTYTHDPKVMNKKKERRRNDGNVTVARRPKGNYEAYVN